MIVLDTDHVSVLKYADSAAHKILTDRMAASADQDIVTTVVSVEEQMRGWLAAIARLRQPRHQIPAYDELLELLAFYQGWTILPFDPGAADEFERLRRQGVRIGAMDLKIASIARVRDALLLSANQSHFGKVPGLRVDDWLH
jgi:tRNA(fMet)-specific endonuclease VapC